MVLNVNQFDSTNRVSFSESQRFSGGHLSPGCHPNFLSVLFSLFLFTLSGCFFKINIDSSSSTSTFGYTDTFNNLPGDPSRETNLSVSVVDTDLTSYRYKVGPSNSTSCSIEAGYSSERSSTSPITSDLTAFADGPLTLCVVASTQSLDRALSYTWTKDTTPPTAIISGAPSGINNTLNLNITVSGTDIVSYQYKVGTTASTNCASSTDYSSDILSSVAITSSITALGDGSITLCVLGKDAVGNTQALASATTTTWTKDATVPTAPGSITASASPMFYRQQTPTFTFTDSTDAGGGVTSYQIEIRKASDGSLVKAYITATGNGTGLTYNEGSDLLTGGENYYTNIRAIDAAGNISNATQSSNWVALICPLNYVMVPARPPYTSLAFCAAKYEMKLQYNSSIVADGNASNTYDFDSDYENATERAKYVASSSVNGRPWVNIKRGENGATTGQGAIEICQTLGSGFDLITNAQWQSIVQNAELVASNWTSGTVGSEMMFRGHSDSGPNNSLSVSNVNDSYDQTTNSSGDAIGSGKEQRRTLTLSNGQVIWDIAGNVWEWVKDGNLTNFGSDIFISQLTDITNSTTGTVGGLTGTAKYLFGPVGTYPSLGATLYGGLGMGYFNANANSIHRGGPYSAANLAGPFSVELSANPASYTAGDLGFRCVFR